jgi:serine/threonine protein kinase/tetratricopeptide (TPR) repeat protein
MDDATLRARDLLRRIVELPAGERERVLDEACGGDPSLRAEVDALRAAAAAAAAGDPPTGSVTAGLDGRTADLAPGSGASAGGPDGAPTERPGQRIGRYRLLEKIGTGGFGSVWAAEQREPVRRRVALKIIKLGMDTEQVIARFEAERQALAMMDHPNIAKVFDAGTTDTGRPFFAMELVRGVPIIEYCDTEKLDTRARLELFALVCRAIQHAHQKGIIHRDIKPSNVLVTLHDGVPVPKVIDFGIAKATNQELTERTIYTQHREMIGTPAYMSPEQAEMSGLDIDTRSDIYSLGVLLYEMLTGTTPFTNEELSSAGLEGMMRMIREVEPHKPSTRLSSLGDTATRTAQQRRVEVRRLGLILRGDLDWIVMRCLEKDRTRRYDTANGLAEDIRRHLNDEPVLAGPPSTGYRLRKFVRRNRGQVAAGLIVAAVLVLGVVGTSLGMARAVAASERADDAASRALDAQAEAQERSRELEAVVAFQSAQLSGIDVPEMGVGLREGLLAGVRRAGATAGQSEADIAARIDAIDGALAGVDFTGLALGSLEQSIFGPSMDAIDARFGDQPAVRADLLLTLGDAVRGLGSLETARRPITESLEIRRTLLGPTDAGTLEARIRAAMLANDLGQHEEAQRSLRETLAIARQEHGDEAAITASVRVNLATALTATLDYAEAAELYEQALTRLRADAGPDDPDTLGCMSSLAISLSNLERNEEAEALFDEATAGFEAVLGSGARRTIQHLNNHAMHFQRIEDRSRAEAILRDALERARTSLGEDHWVTLMIVDNLGGVLFARGEPDQAITFTRRALDGRRRVLGEGHAATMRSFMNLAKVLESQGDVEAAVDSYRRAIRGFRSIYGEFAPFTVSARSALAGLLITSGRFVETESLLLEEYRLLQASPNAPAARRRAVVRAIGLTYSMWNAAEPDERRADEAARWKSMLAELDAAGG